MYTLSNGIELTKEEYIKNAISLHRYMMKNYPHEEEKHNYTIMLLEQELKAETNA